MFSRIIRLTACSALYVWSIVYILLPILINTSDGASTFLSIFRRDGFEQAYAHFATQPSIIIDFFIGPIVMMYILYHRSDTVTLYRNARKHHIAYITIGVIGLMLYGINGMNVLTSPFTVSLLLIIIGFIMTDHTAYGRKFNQEQVDSVD